VTSRTPPEPAAGLDARRRRARRGPTDDYQQRRKELLDAAAQVFRTRGFAKATMSDVAATAGTDRAAAYYYVESKAELFVELTRAALGQGVAGLRAIADGDGSVPDKIRRIVVFEMALYAEHDPCLHLYAMEDISRLDVDEARQGELAALAQQSFEIVRDVVAEGLRDRSLSSHLTAGVIAQTIVGMVAWSNRWYDPSRRPQLDHLADDLAGIVLNGLVTRDA
jgi:AcrR family transcriptional regulator